MPDVVVVSTTVDAREVADALARSAVSVRLAACAQVVGEIDSVYRWQGEVETAREWLVLFKTTADRYAALEEHLLAGHPYDVAEIVCTPVIGGSAAYLDWVREETRTGPDPLTGAPYTA